MTGIDRTGPEPTLRAFLHRSCAAAHAELEAGSALAALLSPTLDLPRYDDLLVRQFALNTALEGTAPASAGSPWTCWFRRALRLEALRRDIARRSLDVGPGLLDDAMAVVRGAGSAPGRDAAWLAGWAYVVVGSVLGGRLIARNVAATLRLHADGGAAFYAGGDIPSQGSGSTHAFFDALNGADWTADERDRMASAAVACMRVHQAWWCAHRPDHQAASGSGTAADPPGAIVTIAPGP